MCNMFVNLLRVYYSKEDSTYIIYTWGYRGSDACTRVGRLVGVVFILCDLSLLFDSLVCSASEIQEVHSIL